MIILGLGSNVGDRLKYLTEAVKLLGDNIIAGIEVSSIYESKAVLTSNAPKDWDKSFLNMAVIGETHLSPHDLLVKIKMVEKKIGRHDRGFWAPREIDIDILAYSDKVIDLPDLQIPHKHLCERSFVMLPLAEIAPNWRFPANGNTKGKTAFELANAFKNDSSIVKTDYKLIKDPALVA